MANPAKTGPFTTLHHICIVVRDIDKAVAFYEIRSELVPGTTIPRSINTQSWRCRAERLSSA